MALHLTCVYAVGLNKTELLQGRSRDRRVLNSHCAQTCLVHEGCLLVLGMLTVDPRALASKWNAFLRGERVQDFAIPHEDVHKFRNLFDYASPDFQIVTEPRFPLPNLEAPAGFHAVFPWFPTDFPWTDSSGSLAVGMKGGAAGHLLHGHGYGDLDMCMFKLTGAAPPRNLDRAAACFLQAAVHNLARVADRVLLVQNPKTVSVCLQRGGDHMQCVQFFLHVHELVSEMLICSDVDVSQVVFCGSKGPFAGLHLSPLAVEAYTTGYMNIRSSFPEEKIKRLIKYVQRGFGIRLRTDLEDEWSSRKLYEAVRCDRQSYVATLEEGDQSRVQEFRDSYGATLPLGTVFKMWDDGPLEVSDKNMIDDRRSMIDDRLLTIVDR